MVVVYDSHVRTAQECKPKAKHDWQPSTTEAVVLLSKLDVDKHIDVEIKLDELDLTSAESSDLCTNQRVYIGKI